MNLATKISLSRVLLAFIFMVCLFVPALAWRVLALFFFTLAVITDIYDGKLARAKGIVTPFGQLVDPLADKILVSCAFISFVGIKEIWVPAWMVVIIITREFCMMGLRLLACGKGMILPAEREGKQKTISQMGAIIVILLYLIARTLAESSGIWSEGMEACGRVGVYTIMSITLIFTITSGYSYLSKHRDVFLK